MQNKSKTSPKQKQNCFVSVLFQHFVHVKQNAETKQNKSRCGFPANQKLTALSEA